MKFTWGDCQRTVLANSIVVNFCWGSFFLKLQLFLKQIISIIWKTNGTILKTENQPKTWPLFIVYKEIFPCHSVFGSVDRGSLELRWLFILSWDVEYKQLGLTSVIRLIMPYKSFPWKPPIGTWSKKKKKKKQNH